MTALLDNFEWRYLPRGGVAHGFYRAPSPHAGAVCGVSPRWFDPDGWLGAGSPAECEHAAGLPRCKRCTRHLGSAT